MAHAKHSSDSCKAPRQIRHCAASMGRDEFKVGKLLAQPGIDEAGQHARAVKHEFHDCHVVRKIQLLHIGPVYGMHEDHSTAPIKLGEERDKPLVVEVLTLPIRRQANPIQVKMVKYAADFGHWRIYIIEREGGEGGYALDHLH